MNNNTKSKKINFPKMDEKRAWSFIGIFLILLVITMPIYSAQSLALPIVQITKNTGEDGIDNYLDGKGDTWTVEATIGNIGEGVVNPETVKIKIGDHDTNFNACSDSAVGAKCQYISPLTDGVQEGVYPFQVIYTFLNNVGAPETASAADVVNADGSAPSITEMSVVQNGQDVRINFKVDDKVRPTAPAVGLKNIQIIDADSGNVLQAISNLNGKTSYQYLTDSGTGGKLVPVAPLTGEGRKRIKITAEDLLGHTTISNPVAFLADFVKPAIKMDTLSFADLGKFIGQYVSTTDVKVDVIEKSDVRLPTAGVVNPGVVAYSDATNLNGQEATCTPDESEPSLWHCLWENIQVNPSQMNGGSIPVRIVATDVFGNTIEAIKTLEFVRDISSPERVFFGTENTFDGQSFVKSEQNRIILQIRKQGANITKENIQGNLVSIGGGANQNPDECNLQTDGTIVCYWDVSNSGLSANNVNIGLSKFEDSVGNKGDQSEVVLFVDNSGATVNNLNIYGTSNAGDKQYFQSNDKIKFKFTVQESHGLQILVGLKDAVEDAATKYPESLATKGLGDGWKVYTHDEVCVRGSTQFQTNWTCELETDEIKSGYENSVPLHLRIRDTAGNDAQEKEAWIVKPITMKHGTQGDYTFELLGLSTEEHPDYWQVPVNGVNTIQTNDFIDIDTTQYYPSRMAFGIQLDSSKRDAKIRKVELIGCENNLPDEVKGRQTLWNNVLLEPRSSPATFNLILGFQPFNSKEYFKQQMEESDEFKLGYIEHDCSFRIYSQVGRNAIQAPEIQQVNVSVPFGFTKLGADTANLEEKIAHEKEEVNTGWWGFIGTFEKALRIAMYLLRLVQIVLDIINIAINIQIAYDGATKVLETNAVTGPPTTTQKVSFCFGSNIGMEAAGTAIQVIQVPLKVLTCHPRTCDLDANCKS